MMSKFVGVFRELSTFTELLHTQIELILVERINHNWLKVNTVPSQGLKHAALREHFCNQGCHRH